MSFLTGKAGPPTRGMGGDDLRQMPANVCQKVQNTRNSLVSNEKG